MSFFTAIKDLMKKPTKKVEVKKTAKLLKEMNKVVDKAFEKPKKPIKKPVVIAKAIKAITKSIKHIQTAELPATHKVVCTKDNAHTCIAIEIINRTIQMVEDFEAGIKRIQDHPNIEKKSKSDIQNYINKNIVTALWVLEPAFPLMKSYKRCKDFQTVLLQARISRSPGLLESKKHIG